MTHAQRRARAAVDGGNRRSDVVRAATAPRRVVERSRVRSWARSHCGSSSPGSRSFAPASPVDLIGTAVWAGSLLAIPISVVSSWRLGGRTRSLHLAPIAAINVAPLVVAIATC
jgi:hypothetical protein